MDSIDYFKIIVVKINIMYGKLNFGILIISILNNF